MSFGSASTVAVECLLLCNKIQTVNNPDYFDYNSWSVHCESVHSDLLAYRRLEQLLWKLVYSK